VTEGAEEASRHGRGRSLAKPAYPSDDGSPDALVRDLLATVARGGVSSIDAARALRGTRLLATVVAVTDEVYASGGDKDSHMAVVSMVNDEGRTGLLAFSGVDSLTAWNPAGRPVAAPGREVARAAIEDGAAAVVIDVAGPNPVVLAGPALAALADEVDLERVTALVQTALAPLTADGRAVASVLDVREEAGAVDVLVVVSSSGGRQPEGRRVDELAARAARILAARQDITSLVPGGVGVTVG
jgi:SseB protein N-terminal domain